MNRFRLGLLVCTGLLACGPWRNVAAQGLIVSLPKDGEWVRFEGTVKQVEIKPDAPEGDVSMEWIQHLTIKSVGGESAMFRGKQVPCRWIEIKIVTGKASESGVDPGPVGERIYKVLVPEERVVGQTVDADQIPFSFLDIVKGFRKIGRDVSPIPIRPSNASPAGEGSGAFQVFPLIAPLMHYDSIEAAGGGSDDIQVPGARGPVRVNKFKGKRVVESPTLRTTNEAEIWRANEKSVPFGLVRWAVKTTLEKKDTVQPRAAFKAATRSTVEMSAHECGTGAKSELTGN